MRVILACEMIEDEVRLALEALPEDRRPPLVWVESGLHDYPARLQSALQDLVNFLDEGARTGTVATLPSVCPGRGPAEARRIQVDVPPVSEVLLALGFCGKGLQGLISKRLRLVFPRVDDCISLFLNPGCAREEIPRDTRSYYLTGGWFRHNSSVNEAFEEWVERFGPERAASLRRAMFHGYERVSLIDTQAYEVDDFVGQSRDYAEELQLDHVIVSGSVQLLEKLFLGEPSSEIVSVPPGEAIGFTHLFGSENEPERGT
ncbi:MAG TPA: DUF1638 domain-containing protein [Thermoleophilia bacterium]|nr:DUF1638 domain-containing protein [Thermoleophilia bacterium]